MSCSRINHITEWILTEESGIEFGLLEVVNPIGWDNVILYGEYIIDKRLIRP